MRWLFRKAFLNSLPRPLHHVTFPALVADSPMAPCCIWRGAVWHLVLPWVVSLTVLACSSLTTHADGSVTTVILSMSSGNKDSIKTRDLVKAF